MDQIAVMGLKALQAYKEQLDKAQEAVEVARVLARKIEVFEVTIGMIPKRGNKDDVEKINKSVPGDDGSDEVPKGGSGGEEKTKNLKDGAKNYAKEAASFAKDQAKTMVMDQVNSFINASPFGVVKDLIMFGGGDKTPITGKTM
jgi:hypothetical protein